MPASQVKVGKRKNQEGIKEEKEKETQDETKRAISRASSSHWRRESKVPTEGKVERNAMSEVSKQEERIHEKSEERMDRLRQQHEFNGDASAVENEYSECAPRPRARALESQTRSRLISANLG